MDTTLIIISVFLAVVLVGLIVVYKKIGQTGNAKTSDEQLFLMMQQQLQDLGRIIDQKTTETNKSVFASEQNLNKTVQAHYGQNLKIITEITERLSKLDETNRQVVSFATQLQDLEDVLQNPKHRGILGEYFLENVLQNVLPPNSYQMQYRFDDGDIVDAVVFVKDKIIPIDSKFSLENYNRIVEEKNQDRREELEVIFKNDLKRRIDETSKYIKPKEGTMEFAFMFIPAEGIYYDLLINQVGALKTNTHDLIEYATKEKHVIIVSPTSFLAYLQTVLQGLRALQIEESAKEIRKRVEDLSKHMLAYDEYLKKLGTSLGSSVSHFNNAYKEYNKIDKDVVKITGGERSVEMMQIEKPQMEE